MNLVDRVKNMSDPSEKLEALMNLVNAEEEALQQFYEGVK